MFTWNVVQMNRLTSNGFVTTAHWTASAVDGDYSASTYATSSWADGTPTTPYADLTQTTVLGWIWTNGVDKDATEASLASQIALQKNPITSTGVPW